MGIGACAARAARGLACVRACARTPVRVCVRLRERPWTLRGRLCLCVGPWIGSGRLYVRARSVVGCVWLGEFGCVCAPVCVLCHSTTAVRQVLEEFSFAIYISHL